MAWILKGPNDVCVFACLCSTGCVCLYMCKIVLNILATQQIAQWLWWQITNTINNIYN